MSRSWPELPEEHRWAIELMEERLKQSELTPDELRQRARELRAEAAETGVEQYREAALTLAERYEEAAASRVAPA